MTSVDRRSLRNWGRALVAGSITLLASAWPVLAQDEVEGPPPLLPQPAHWVWVIAAVFLAGFLVIAFKNPKRSHQA